MVRFIENHDEPRAAAAFPSAKVRLPVFLGRRPAEPVDADLAAFYRRLLDAVDRDVFRNGEWRLCERSGWPDNQNCRNILAWCWVGEDERYLIIINFGQSKPGTTAPAIELMVLHNAAGQRRNARLVSISRAELPPARDLLREAQRALG